MMKSYSRQFHFTNLAVNMAFMIGGFVVTFLVITLLAGRETDKERPVEREAIRAGVEYKLNSYEVKTLSRQKGSSKRLNETVLVYILTLQAPNEKKQGDRMVVSVPEEALVLDFNLPEDAVVWDHSSQVDGWQYGRVRWNPSGALPSLDMPMIAPDYPVTKVKKVLDKPIGDNP